MRKFAACLLFAYVSFSALFSQETSELQEKFLEAEYFLMNEDYQDALGLYQQLYEQLPDNANLAHSIGICYLNIEGKKNQSVPFLEAAVKNMSSRHREGTIAQSSAPYDALYDLAKAYRINYMFDKAKEAYARYSETLLPEDVENRNYINHEIAVCDNAKQMIAKPVDFTEVNMGETFNDENSNFDPVISGDGKTFAYMASLKFYDAVMISKFTEGKWTAPLNITPELQSDGDYYISSLSFDGKTLLLSKNDDFNSDIYSSAFDGITWSKAVRLNKYINTKYWESQGFISDDQRYLIFSSDRPGGFGGLDLYISVWMDGNWGPAVNLGPEINTPFNDDRPFLANNGRTLFFSSQGHENMGGYDIFRSERVTDQSWGKPLNLGYPINTPDDNYFFSPAEDGSSVYYSVFRDSKGFGKEDIYRISLK
jgi:tetratricopeptide (TPR) repeat protein